MNIDPSFYKAEFKRLNCCVLIPTYNNPKTIKGVIESVLAYSTDVVVVNDGSTDDTATILSLFGTQIQVVTHPKNAGKGVALKTGFDYAFSQGYRYAITMDSDGQHFAKDLPTFLEKLETEKNTIFIGARNMDQESVPGKSNVGNFISNFWFKFETGINAPDTQSGYRLYPLEPLQKMQFITWKFEFEIEVLVRSSWAGVGIDSVPVSVFYAPGNQRISHFRPFQDFVRIGMLHTVLSTLAFLYYIPVRFWQKIKKKRLSEILSEAFLDPNETALKKSVSVAFGVFMGIVPIWGYQLLVGIFLAKILKINIPIFILAANISIPPNIPWIIFLSMWIGASIYGLDQIVPNIHDISFAIVKQHFKQYVTGSMILATLGGIILGGISYPFFAWVKPKQ